MEHYRLRKYRGPEVWKRVREAYEAGESGKSVARRFDVGLANLRKKSRREGWSRKDTAARLDRELEPARPDPTPTDAAPAPPVDPRKAVEEAMQRAGGLLVQGRGGEAQVLVRSAEALARLADRAEPARAAEADDEARSEDDLARLIAQRDADIIAEATRLAHAMLMDQPMGESGRYGAFLYHWRARHLGPEATASDFAYAVDGGWAPNYFDAEGRLRPLPEPITPLGMMVAQHLRRAPNFDAIPGWRHPYTMDLDYAGPINDWPPSDGPGID
ncbi:hypothetical protein SH203_02657 [Brevundimonas sp. SH203]|uniref:hypothetical protein n=1 Tax=Brevundimonas sp. SH203 TaxID=345167 RepID=UPI0009D17AD8|nr:hypothetical protein [Brevundimonas sp. SH203]GAW42241.1 hypothetical protein SH203_02657 [Brevundimonas sp. SH203]